MGVIVLVNKPSDFVEGMLSIVVPLYEHDEYIEELIKSIICIEYKHLEVIIIDDASKDKSYEIAKSTLLASELNYRVIRNQENLGICKTLNKLISLARGEFILPIGSDDIIVPDTVAPRIKIFKENLNVDVLVSDCHIIDEDSNILEHFYLSKLIKHPGLKSCSEVQEFLVGNWCLPGSLTMYRANIFNSVGGFNENIQHEDWEFFLRMVNLNSILFYVEKASIYYRLHAENTHKKNARRAILEHIVVALPFLFKRQFKFKTALIKRVIILAASYLKLLFVKQKIF